MTAILSSIIHWETAILTSFSLGHIGKISESEELDSNTAISTGKEGKFGGSCEGKDKNDGFETKKKEGFGWKMR